MYTVTHANRGDLEQICLLFEQAIAFQKKNHFIGWESFDRAFVEADIEHNLLYKITSGDSIACIFSICVSDELIWREKEKGDAVYLHRIVLNQAFKGEQLFAKVLDWAIDFATEWKLLYIRMDTWAANDKIIAYYKSYGFRFVENYTTPNSEHLPLQHRNLTVALLQLDLPAAVSDRARQKVNIPAAMATVHRFWDQKIIGECNGQLIKLAKGTGAIHWHQHDDQDELFLLYKGQLTIQLKGRNVDLLPGDLFVVPKGAPHCPVSHGVSEFLIMGLNVTSNAAGGRPAHFDQQQ